MHVNAKVSTQNAAFIVDQVQRYFWYVVSLTPERVIVPGARVSQVWKEERQVWASSCAPTHPTTFLPEQVSGWSFSPSALALHHWDWQSALIVVCFLLVSCQVVVICHIGCPVVLVH